MNKETVKRKYERHFGIEPNDDELDFYFDIIDSVKEECAMIFENQISDENTDEANTNLSLNAKAIREG